MDVGADGKPCAWLRRLANANSSAQLGSLPFGTTNNIIISCNLTSTLLNVLTNDTNRQITFVLVDTDETGTAAVHSRTSGGTPPTLRVQALYIPGLRAIDVTPGSFLVSTTNDLSAGFTYDAAEATSVTFDFSAFGTGAGSMDLSGCSSTIGDYAFGGFTVNPTGVTVDNSAKTITFTGGTLANGAMTIDNVVAGTGWRMINATSAGKQPVTVSTASSSKTFDLTLRAPMAVVALSPANNVKDVYPSTNLVATFNRPITLVNGGKIIITNLTDHTSTVITVPNNQLSFGSSNLTISLYAPFSVTGCTYAVQISTNTVKDLYGDAFAGISDTTTWRFSPSVGLSIVASDNALVASDGLNTDYSESTEGLSFRGNPRRTNYLRFNVSTLKRVQSIRYATLDLQVNRTPTVYAVGVFALKDGYTNATRRSETDWTSALTANLAPGYAAWPNADSSAMLTSRAVTPNGTITSFNLTDKMLSVLTNDTNGEITFIMVSLDGAGEDRLHSLTSGGAKPTLNVLFVPKPPDGTLILFM
jgi:Bacterial Ig-like domain